MSSSNFASAASSAAGKDKAVKLLIDDAFKQFKVSGDFDRFRKEYFVEITSSSSFQNLTKSIDEFIHRLLDDHLKLHHHQPSSLKKNDLREHVRRRLFENHSFNQQINAFINQTTDSKIENSLKPIISSLVDKLAKSNEICSTESTVQATSTTTTTSSSDNVSMESNNSPPPQPLPAIESKPQASQPQRKVSIEDFLCVSESKTGSEKQLLPQQPSTPTSQTKSLLAATAATTTAKLTTHSSGHHQQQQQQQQSETKPTKMPSSKLDDLSLSLSTSATTKKEDKKTPLIGANTGKSEPTKPPQQLSKQQSNSSSSNKKATTTTTTTSTVNQPSTAPSSSYEFMRKLSFANESKLQLDPSNHYNFDWKLDHVPDSSIMDTISVSSDDDDDDSDDDDYDDEELSDQAKSDYTDSSSSSSS